MAKLTTFEREVLEMVAETRPWAGWGAWLGACLDSLYGSGLITAYVAATLRLTEAGRLALASSPASSDEG